MAMGGGDPCDSHPQGNLNTTPGAEGTLKCGDWLPNQFALATFQTLQ